MIIGPKYKICRRLGSGIFSKCQTTRFAIMEGKKKVGAKSGRRHRSTKTEFGTQLLEKQKVRYSYGLNERQLVNYVKDSKKRKGTTPSAEIFKLLETRLDNVLYRMGLFPSRQFARQAVVHGHIVVNDKRVTKPSYSVRVGETIGVRPASAQKGILKGRAETIKEYNPPSWLSVDKEAFKAKINAFPSTTETGSDINFSFIVQFYSRV